MALINGLTSLSPLTVTILATDSYQGAIYRIDVTTGQVSMWLQDFETMGTRGSSSAGINGIKVFRPPSPSPSPSSSSCGETEQERDKKDDDDDDDQDETLLYIYYTNTDRALVARIPITTTTTHSTTIYDPSAVSPQIIATNDTLPSGVAPDDLAVLDDGSILVATGTANAVVHVSLSGIVFTLAGSKGDLALASSTACQLSKDGKVVYVTTAGGEEGAVSGTVYGPGSVVAVEL